MSAFSPKLPWLSPAGAKTLWSQATEKLGAHIVSTISSDGALLSASSRKQKVKGATGGLLRAIGDRGIEMPTRLGHCGSLSDVRALLRYWL